MHSLALDAGSMRGTERAAVVEVAARAGVMRSRVRDNVLSARLEAIVDWWPVYTVFAYLI